MSPDTLRVLIADDEPLVREGVREPLRALPDVEVVGECGSGRAALEAIRRLQPDVAFLDVRMPGLDGFEVLEELSDAERPVIVFVTAYDEYALAAFRAQAVDYLLKPFSLDDVGAALDRARTMVRGRSLDALEGHLERALAAVPEPPAPVRRLSVRVGPRTVILDVDRIDYLEADGNYVEIHVGGATYLARDSLRALERELPAGRFVRLHRSFLVPFDRIRELRPAGGERWEVILEGGTRLPVSESGRARLIRMLGRSPGSRAEE